MIEQLRQMLSISLSMAVQKLGPVPDEYGDKIKQVFAEEDDIAYLALGCALDDCIAHGSYLNLKRGFKE